MVYDPEFVLSAFNDGEKKTATTWSGIPGTVERQSAVLVPFFARSRELFLLMVERSDMLRRHPGQIAFPGGAREPGDIGPVQTALREFEEETGVPSGRVDILALLPEEHAYSSDFTLYPVVGFINGDLSVADLRPDPVEVRRLIEIPLREFSGSPLMEDFDIKGKKFHYPVFWAGDGVRIWGATAWVILRLIRIIERDTGRPECH